MLQDDWLRASAAVNPSASALSDVIFHLIGDALGGVDEDVVRICAGVAVAVASVVVAGWALGCFGGRRDRAAPTTAGPGVQTTVSYDDYDDRKGRGKTRAPVADSGAIEKPVVVEKVRGGEGYVDYDDKGKKGNAEDYDSDGNQGASPEPQEVMDSLLPPPTSARASPGRGHVPIPAVTPESSPGRRVTRSMTARAGRVRAIAGT